MIPLGTCPAPKPPASLWKWLTGNPIEKEHFVNGVLYHSHNVLHCVWAPAVNRQNVTYKNFCNPANNCSSSESIHKHQRKKLDMTNMYIGSYYLNKHHTSTHINASMGCQDRVDGSNECPLFTYRSERENVRSPHEDLMHFMAIFCHVGVSTVWSCSPPKCIHLVQVCNSNVQDLLHYGHCKYSVRQTRSNGGPITCYIHWR